MKVELIAETKFLKLDYPSDDIPYTDVYDDNGDLEKLTYYAAKICHNKHEGSENKRQETIARFIKKFVIDMDHSSLLEHYSFTFLVEGISRCCSHQLVRHRIASYHMLSQRHVAENKSSFVIPKSIREIDLADELFHNALNSASRAYMEMIDMGIPLEDARYILPGAIETSILVTWNARTLLHVLKLRLWKDGAQWEIKEMLQKMLDIVKTRSDVIFNEPKS